MVRSRGFGIGTGCVVNGNIMNGHLGLAGEGGYMGINYNQARGNKGTFEYCAGSESAARYVKERLFEFPDTILNEKSTYLEVFDAYRKGDALATWAVHKVAWMLGYGIANIIYLINPDCIIIGPDYPDTKDFVKQNPGGYSKFCTCICGRKCFYKIFKNQSGFFPVGWILLYI